jgi:hypothetical protein
VVSEELEGAETDCAEAGATGLTGRPEMSVT